MLADNGRAVGKRDLSFELWRLVQRSWLDIRWDVDLRSLRPGILKLQAVSVDSRVDTVDLVSGEEAVFDSLTEAIGVGRIAEILVCIDIVISLRRGRHPELDRIGE